MDKAWKFATILSGIFVGLAMILAVSTGTLNFATLCFMGYIFIGLTIFFWLAYIFGKALYNTETKLWDWMNEKPPKNNF